MKQVTFNIENTIIQFSNDWMGNETISLNGEQVSKKFSIFGTKHHFTIKNNDSIENYAITSKINFKNDLTITLLKDDIKVEEKHLNYFEKDSNNFNSTFIIGIMFLLIYISNDSNYFGLLGLIFIIISFSNKTKNTEEKDIIKKE